MPLLDLKFLEIYDLYLRYYLNLALVYIIKHVISLKNHEKGHNGI